MRHCSFLLAACCLLAGQLYAQPVYNDTATSVSGRAEISTDNPGLWTLSFSGPGFQLGAEGGDALGNPIPVGQPIPLDLSFSYNSYSDAAGVVDFGGITTYATVDGLAQMLSSSTFVLPSNPDPTYIFPAHMTGQFIARPLQPGQCNFAPPPPCDASAVLSIDLPVELTVHVGSINPDRAFVYETFESVPEPSSVELWLLGAGSFGIVWLARRRKARTLPC